VKKSCWKIELVTKDGPFTMPANCEYMGEENVNKNNCIIDFSKSGIKDPPSGESLKNLRFVKAYCANHDFNWECFMIYFGSDRILLIHPL
jgi:hypothetical protein